MKFGIIAAEEKEMFSVKKIMKDVNFKEIYNINFFEGEIENTKCVLVKCGVRKS